MGSEESTGFRSWFFSFFECELNFIDVIKHGYWLHMTLLTSLSWIVICLSLIDRLFQNYAFWWIFFSFQSYFCYNFFEIQLCMDLCCDEILSLSWFFLSNPFWRMCGKKIIFMIVSCLTGDLFWLSMRIWLSCLNCSSSNNNWMDKCNYISYMSD